MSAPRLSVEMRGALACFPVRLQPRASRDEITGLLQGALKVRLTAPPVEGRANRRLIEFLAKQLGQSRSRLQIISGHKSRSKTVSVAGLTPAEIQTRIAEILYNQ